MTNRFDVALVLVMLAAWTGTASAQEQATALQMETIVALADSADGVEPEPVGPKLPRPIADAAEYDRLRRALENPPRPRALVGLYVSLAGLNALDVYSTTRALNRGAHEANPVMGSVASHSGMSLAIKAGTTAGAIVLAEKLWKKNRAAAIVTMVAVNAATAAVVAKNFRNAR